MTEQDAKRYIELGMIIKAMERKVKELKQEMLEIKMRGEQHDRDSESNNETSIG